MATAFLGSIYIKKMDGTVQIEKFDNADTANAYSTFASTGGSTWVNVQGDGYITAIVLNVVATDTTDELNYYGILPNNVQKLWINQKDVGIRWPQANSYPTNQNPFPSHAPIPVKKGDTIQLQAVT